MKFECRSVSYTYDVLPVLDSLSLLFPEHGCTIIYGANGVGKSTLFDLLIGDRTPTDGTVYINGQSTKVMKTSQRRELRRKLGIVNQSHTFSPHYSLEEQIMIPLLVCGMKEREARKRTMDILSEHELSHLRSKFPSQASEGELRILSLIRAIVFEPDFMVIDEPYNELDHESVEIFIRILKPYFTDKKGVIIFTREKNIAFSQPSHRFEFSAGSLKKIDQSKQGDAE